VGGGGFGSPQLDFKVRQYSSLGEVCASRRLSRRFELEVIPAARRSEGLASWQAVRHDIERLRWMMTLVADGLEQVTVTPTLPKARA
jgi:hypothetical protein